MSDIFINYKEENPIYAPGIGTYGATGEKGDTGKNGNGIYYYPSNINKNEQAKASVNAKIASNKLLYSTSYEDNPNEYQENDIVIDSFGDVFRIIRNDNEELCIGDCIGSISPNTPNILEFINYESGKILKLKDGLDANDINENYIINIYTAAQGEYNQYFNINALELNTYNFSGVDSIIAEICSINSGICSKYKLL